jgi:Protein of unknown function (DUF2911)
MMRTARQVRRLGDRYFHGPLFWVLCFVLSVLATSARTSVAQQTAADSLTGSAVCTFDDGKQMSTRYKPAAVARSEEAVPGKVWAPGGLAMTLFAETDLTLGNTLVPAGAYTMYLLPGKRDWTLIVSRNVTIDSKYDQNQDLVRATMQTGELSQTEAQLKVFFGHIGPKRCEINVDYGKSRAWIDFVQK